MHVGYSSGPPRRRTAEVCILRQPASSVTFHRQVTSYVPVLKAIDPKSLQQLLDRALALLPPHGQQLVYRDVWVSLGNSSWVVALPDSQHRFVDLVRNDSRLPA